MTKLNNIKRTSFSVEDLEKYPVWTWDDERENLVPIAEKKLIWDDYDTFFIYAHFKTQDRAFDGYLIGGTTYYGFSIIVKGIEFIININLPELLQNSLNEIYSVLKCNPFQLFPLRYESPICSEDGIQISGTFEFENGKLSCVPDNSKRR